MMIGFQDHQESGLFLARARQYFKIVPRATVEGTSGGWRTILAYSNDAPALVERFVGRGVSLLFTSSANMEWNNLPAKGDFVSLAWNLVIYAWPRGGTAAELLVGSTIQRRLSPREYAGDNAFVLPSGRRIPAEVRPLGDGFVAQLTATEELGVYRFQGPEAAEHYAVSADPRESDLRPIDEAELRREIGAPFELLVDERPDMRADSALLRRGLGWHLLYLALVLAVIEPLLAMWFGHHR